MKNLFEQLSTEHQNKIQNSYLKKSLQQHHFSTYLKISDAFMLHHELYDTRFDVVEFYELFES